MQVYNTPQISNTKPMNFKAIKSVKCEGLYKKFPQYGKELVDTFRKNPVAMDFCKKYDVNIVFYSAKKALNDVESSIHVFFNNPAKKKFLGIFGSKRDNISLSAYANQCNVKDNVENTTNILKAYIEADVPGKTSGVLDQHIKLKEEDIAKFLAENRNKVVIKQAEIIAKKQETLKQLNDTKNLDASIKDLINSSK